MEYYLKLLLLVFIARSVIGGRSRRSSFLETVYQWNQLDFNFPSDADRQEALNNGNYIPGNILPIDVAPQYYAGGQTRVFVTIPRFIPGTPFSLATVSSNGLSLTAYPDYSWHSSHGSDCDGITSAFRVAFTPCNQMWVIDSGAIGGTQYCPPKLLLFDLTTDRLVHSYSFPESVYIPRASVLITPVIQVNDPPPSGNCARTTVYVADVGFHGLIVYDQEQGASWRAEHRFMYPNPEHGLHTIADDSFSLMDGIFGLSIVGPNLYFNALASEDEYSVPLNVLADRSAFEANFESHSDAFEKVGSRDSQCAAKAADSRGNIYCVTFKPINLIRWNVATPYKKKHLHKLSSDKELLQFVSGMKVVKNPSGNEELWLLSNRYQKNAIGAMRADEVNFRILKRSLDDVDGNTIDSISNSDLHSQLIFN